MNTFWSNWNYRVTSFDNGDSIVELRFFGNNFNHVESTTLEGTKRLELDGFGIETCKGGGFEGLITYTLFNY